MFKKSQYKLLLSYLLVLFIILSGFAIAVRIISSRNLFNELIQKLTALGQGVGAGAEYEAGVFKPADEDTRDATNQKQGLQWFDAQGKLLEQQGKFVLNLPLVVNQPVQIQNQILGVTTQITDSDTNHLIGYVRASESLEDFNQTLHNLDLGLAGGVVVAVILSGVGGIWLTRLAMQPIEESFQKLQQFTADASHELRNPMMEIKSNAAIALKYPEGIRADDEERFQFIVAATDQVTRLAEDLLFLARTDRAPKQNWQRFNLTDLLTELIQKYESKATAKSLELHADLSDWLHVMGDSSQLTRLFSNLIDNALYYTPAGGKIEILASRNASYLQVSIQDTGVGIAREHLTRIFDRFWRADQSRARWEGGSGLGLSIAQGIAQLHGGKITVTSQLNVGSCFTVRLPIAN